MSQHDYVLENQSGASFRADLNSALEAVVTNNAGGSAPIAQYPHMPWADETSGMMKYRNTGNTAWVTSFDLDTGLPTLLSPTSVLNAIATGATQTSYKNLLINSNFQVNNGEDGTPYVSGATLAAGQTGHECWKAGASGGDYTFTQNAAITGITIASGKSLIQVIEAKFVKGGAYILHWTGTAKCRAGVNSDTPSGTYVTSPLVITGQSRGVTMSIEVANDGSGGTCEESQLESGSICTEYEFGADELRRTQRYLEIYKVQITGPAYTSGCYLAQRIVFKAEKASTPLIGEVTYISSNNIKARYTTEVDSGGVTEGIVSTSSGIITELKFIGYAVARL